MMKISVLSCIILVILLLSGCSFPGKVFFSVHCDPSQTPTLSWDIDVPNIPTGFVNFDSIELGAYYKTQPGSYSVSYSYPGPVVQSLNFELTADITLFGNEDAFYDLIIDSGNSPQLIRIPN